MHSRLKLILIVFAVLGGLFGIFSPEPVLAAQPAIVAYDTVAGFSTMISVSGMVPKNEVNVIVRNPDGAITNHRTFADSSGSFGVEVPENDLHLAGSYDVALEGFSLTASFTVFPGDLSVDRSGIFPNKFSAVANGVDNVSLQVMIADEFLNPLAFHEVRLVSSRSEDRIVTQNSETDTNGVARFNVYSGKSGVSAFSAFDETAGAVITSRAQITFTGSGLVYKEIGGDTETVLLAAGESVSKFRIDNLPASVNINDPISFTVSAVDSNGAVVSSYAGTVVFTSTDQNAKLPNQYTFKSSDQGSMTFNVALSFATAGTHTLTVQEQGNAIIKGQKTVQVTTQKGAVAGQVRITKPATGTYSLNTLEIAGEALPNARVKLFDNGQQITEVQASTSGRFSYTTSLLSDGVHTFHAESGGVQSPEVEVTIDSTPAQVEQVDITKPELAPGESTTLSVRSDPDLSKVEVKVNGVVTDLEEDPQNPGLYNGSITAPLEEGDYPLDVVITDTVGNVSAPVEIGSLHVDSALTTGNVSFAVPSAVTGLRATTGSGKVLLTWSAAQAQSGIAFYRVYYGTDPQNLVTVVNTTGPGTSFEVANLQNGTPYYFQLFGVDTEGNEGDNPSEVVNAVPAQGANGPVLCDPSPCPQAGYPDGIPEDGPGVLGMVIASLIGSGAYRYLRKRK